MNFRWRETFKADLSLQNTSLIPQSGILLQELILDQLVANFSSQSQIYKEYTEKSSHLQMHLTAQTTW
jgi:hypothetical protein